MSLVATLLLSPTVKEFLKSANISQSYEQISSGTFFKVHSVSITVWYLVLVLEILFLVVDLAKDLLCKCNWIKEYMTLLSFGKDIIMLQQFAKVFLMRSLVQRVLPIVRFVKHLLNRSWEYVCGETEAESMCVAKQKLRVCVRRNRSWEYVCGEARLNMEVLTGCCWQTSWQQWRSRTVLQAFSRAAAWCELSVMNIYLWVIVIKGKGERIYIAPSS